jgi:hypothetical protein
MIFLGLASLSFLNQTFDTIITQQKIYCRMRDKTFDLIQGKLPKVVLEGSKISELN